jgi:ParE toxin of type II toxin-antitoxin system, parDE
MTLIVLDEAELLEAVNYYEEAAGLGAQFRDEVSAGVAWILENPRVLRLRPGNYYRLNLRVFPYYLPYIILDDDFSAQMRGEVESILTIRSRRQIVLSSGPPERGQL